MSKKSVGVVRFPGTNCDRDVWGAVEKAGHQARWLWHADQFDWQTVDSIVIPGGFSYGDYLRAGALAARSPVMKSVFEAAQKGVPILGICNGFQILCEVGLLPGALVLNSGLRFVDRWEPLKLMSSNTYWGSTFSNGCRVCLPVAHAEGRYYIEEARELMDRNQVWWTYEDNPNGSIENIAGVMNEQGNVAGLMPHPERAVVDWMGSDQGRPFFGGLR